MQRLKAYLFFNIFILATIGLKANNDSIINLLMQRIAQQQQNDDTYFYPGIFPSYREYAPKANRFKKDENIYFTGLIAFSLRNLYHQLTPAQQVMADSIFRRMERIAPKYANRKGRNTYNYWPTDTLRIFPNSGWINFLFDKKMAIADDLDDTAIMLLALNAPDSVVASVHKLMQQYKNKRETPVKHTLNNYKKYGAYSIWFGKRMLVEFDVCVMSNILYMVKQYNLPFSTTDEATIELLAEMMEKRHYMRFPEKISVYYKRPSIILYHMARLMNKVKIPALEKYRTQLIADALSLLQKEGSFMEKVMLRTALLNWGVNLSDEIIVNEEHIIELAENDSMVFFIANLACTMPKPISFLLVKVGISKFCYYCPAYNNMLLLEYLLLKKQADKHMN